MEPEGFHPATTPQREMLSYEPVRPRERWPLGIAVGSFIVSVTVGTFAVVAGAIVLLPERRELPIRLSAAAFGIISIAWLIRVCVFPGKGYSRGATSAARAGFVAAIICWMFILLGFRLVLLNL